MIVDVATLTGHMVVALGDRVAGVFGEFARRPSAESSRPPPTGPASCIWHDADPARAAMDDQRADRSSRIAEAWPQHDWVRWGNGALRRGVPARAFTAEDVPWAHFDIARSVVEREVRPWGHVDLEGGTGFSISTLVDYAPRSLCV